MASGKIELFEINVHVGENFEVALYSQPGSTGYSWYLAGLPAGVAFLGETTAPVPPATAGSKTRQTFTFAACRSGSGQLLFELLRPWTPCEPADVRGFVVNVTAAAAKDESLAGRLTAEAGRGRFVSQPPFLGHYPPTTLYGFPPESPKARTNAGATAHFHPIPPYGFPGGTALHTVVESAENCVVKYGVPWGVTTDSDQCILKYGFPPGGGVQPLYGFPVDCATVVEPAEGDRCVVKYGTPGGVTADSARCVVAYGFPTPKYGFPTAVARAEGDCCIVKYGTPNGVAASDAECTVKYGFPTVKYGFPVAEGAAAATAAVRTADGDCCVVKYGTPNGVAASDAECTVKYGFPTVKYGFPVAEAAAAAPVAAVRTAEGDCCIVKYGTPGGVAASDAECTVKYGFPTVKYGFPASEGARAATAAVRTAEKDCCVVKYGTPQGVAASDAECTLKYGFPTVKYGFPAAVTAAEGDACVVKYGTPNGPATDAANCTLKYGAPRV